MRLLLVSLWFLFIASASFWLPAYEGDIGGEELALMPVYAAVAAVAAIGVRGRAESAREALVSALPILTVLGLTALAGHGMNEQAEDERGGPIYLYFGIAVWASWASLVSATAVVSRTKWIGFAGIVVSCFVTLFGLVLFTAQID